MKKRALIIALLTMGIAVATQAVDSLYTGPDGGEFFTAPYWSAGIPNHDLNISGIIDSSIVQLSYDVLDDSITGDDRLRNLTISNGTFNIKNGGNYQTENGGLIWTRVGVGTGNTGTVNIEPGGKLTLLGAGADLFVGEVGGAKGFVNVADGATLAITKALEILNGQVTLGATISSGGKTLGDELVVDNGGVLAFETDGATISTIPGATLIVELGSTSTLDMQLGGAFSPGDSWTILTDASGFSGVTGGDGTGVFGTVTNTLDPSHTFTIDYGVTTPNAIVVTLDDPFAALPNELIASGNWAVAGSWVTGIPSSVLEAIVNSNLTAHLSAGSGNAKYLQVGTIDSQSGTVTNGALNVVNATEIGTGSNAVGVVALTAYTAGTASDDTSIGTGDNSSGSLVAGSGALTGTTLTLGSGLNGSGELDMGSGSATFDAVAVINGTLDAASLTFGELAVANNGGTNATVTVTSFTQSPSGGNISVGYGASSVAAFTGTGSIDAGVVAMGTGNNSTGSINVGAGSVTVGTELRVANNTDSTGLFTAGAVTIAGGKKIQIATGTDSMATLSVTSITLPATNGIFVGTGAGSSHNLSASDLSITGPIGGFGVGEGTGAEITGLINTYDSYGSLTVNTPLAITAKDHQITALTLNANLTLGGGATGGLVDGAGVTVASIADSNVTFDFSDWVSGGVTSGPINVARGENAIGTMAAADLVLDNTLQVGGGGSGNNGTVTVVSLDGEGNNSKQVKIADGTGTASTGTVTVVGNARIDDTWVGSGPDAVGELNVGGTLTITNGTLHLADAVGADGTVTVAGASILKAINVASGSDSTATLNLADLTNGGILAVAKGIGSTGTVTLDSLAGDNNLDIAAYNISATGTVSVAGDATISQLRMAIKNNSKATLTVDGTLNLPDGDGTRYFNLASANDCLVNLSAGTLNKGKTNSISVVKSGGTRSQGYVTATYGTLVAARFEIAAALEGTALFAVTNGTLAVGDVVRIGTGANSDGTVLIDLSSYATNAVNLGTASNAVGRLTMVGSGTVYASELNLGQTNSGVHGQGILTLAGGNIVITGALEVATGSYIDVTTDSDSSFKWDGDYEALWNAGALRSNGITGPDNAFGAYFAVLGDGTLIETPVGFIVIANGTGGMDISWESTPGWNYTVKTNANLIIPSWGSYGSTVSGDGTVKTVTIPMADAETFYKVIAAPAP